MDRSEPDRDQGSPNRKSTEEFRKWVGKVLNEDKWRLEVVRNDQRTTHLAGKVLLDRGRAA